MFGNGRSAGAAVYRQRSEALRVRVYSSEPFGKKVGKGLGGNATGRDFHRILRFFLPAGDTGSKSRGLHRLKPTKHMA